MMLGQKIKIARTNAGLSQEQLAQKLCVSRAAIAKWETDKGLPDIMNLKALAQLLDVSVDSLLSDETTSDRHAAKERIDWAAISFSGKSHRKYDAAVRHRFPNAEHIYSLSCVHDFNKFGKIMNVLTFGLLANFWQLTHWKKYAGHYYWVETESNRNFFVQIEEDFLSCLAQNKPLLRSERSHGIIEIAETSYRVGFDLL